VPSAQEASGLPPAEARQVIQAQAADFDAYRQRLAGRVPAVADAGSGRVATGKVQTQVEDRKAATAPVSPDKLTLSRGAVAASSPEEARIASDAERKAADARVAELSRNVKELRDLTASGVAGGAAAPASAPGVTIATPPAVAPPAPAPASEAASAAPPVVAAAPAASPVAPRPKMQPAPAPKPASGGFSAWLDSPYVLPAAGALAIVLLGVGGMAYSRRKRGVGNVVHGKPDAGRFVLRRLRRQAGGHA
jgi:pilus assembly protein FimV